LYHSTLGLRAIKKRREEDGVKEGGGHETKRESIKEWDVQSLLI